MIEFSVSKAFKNLFDIPFGSKSFPVNSEVVVYLVNINGTEFDLEPITIILDGLKSGTEVTVNDADLIDALVTINAVERVSQYSVQAGSEFVKFYQQVFDFFTNLEQR